MATKSTPIASELPFTQLVSRSPSPSAGTRPDAIPPTTVPMKNGVSSDDSANIAPNARRCSTGSTALRNAKPAPRRTIPSAASVSGTNSVDMIAANASENAVQSTTRQKISHTWLASHTGASARSISARGRSPRSASPAKRSQKPTPKSAPPKIA